MEGGFRDLEGQFRDIEIDFRDMEMLLRTDFQLINIGGKNNLPKIRWYRFLSKVNLKTI
jgi:hypothetical protein